MGSPVESDNEQFNPNYIDDFYHNKDNLGPRNLALFQMLFSPHLNYLYVPEAVWINNLIPNIQNRAKS